MKRWWLLMAAGAVSALVLLQLTRPEPGVPAPLNPAPPADETTVAEAQPEPPGAVQPEPSVEVQQEPSVAVQQVLIEAPYVHGTLPSITAAHRTAGTNTGRAVSSRRVAGPSSGPSAAAQPPPQLFERAKRAFLGNGRHRPEPFPRVKGN